MTWLSVGCKITSTTVYCELMSIRRICWAWSGLLRWAGEEVAVRVVLT